MRTTHPMTQIVFRAKAGLRLADVGPFMLAMCTYAGSAAAAAETPAGGATPTSVESIVSLRAAAAAPDLRHVEYLSVTSAGRRLVAVGERGTIALSDDHGKTFRQAKSVPVQATLTDVAFADDKVGWAVGHWGTVLMTRDGGENWSLQRHDVTVDQPLFSVHFSNARDGVAVGLWSLLLVTSDGGAHWNNVKLPALKSAEKGDANLYHAFADGSGGWLVTAERGTVWHSADRGATWHPTVTGYAGSLWSGVVLKNGDILVGGLRGSIYASRDHGATWTASKSNTKSSITGLMQLADETILGIGLDGVRIRSSDGGQSFLATQVSDRTAFTAAVSDGANGVVYFTAGGIRGQ